MPVRVMQVGLPTSRFQDPSSPVLDGIGNAASTLLQLGPELGRIKLEKDRLALEQSRESREQKQSENQMSRQAEQDQMNRVKEAPGNFTATPSPYMNALAEQQQTENASKGIRPSPYVGANEHPAAPPSVWSPREVGAEMQNETQASPLRPAPQKSPYDHVFDSNSTNPQDRASSTYSDWLKNRQLMQGKIGAQINDIGLRGEERTRTNDIRQQNADTAQNRADAIDPMKRAQMQGEAAALKDRYDRAMHSLDIEVQQGVGRNRAAQIQAERDRLDAAHTENMKNLFGKYAGIGQPQQDTAPQPQQAPTTGGLPPGWNVQVHQ